jgi:hypothetical protein
MAYIAASCKSTKFLDLYQMTIQEKPNLTHVGRMIEAHLGRSDAPLSKSADGAFPFLAEEWGFHFNDTS